MTIADAAATEPEILVDADACPVKEEIYRVAERHGVPVVVVSASGLRVPRDGRVTQILAGDRFDAADDVIAARAGNQSVVVTADILLADRCLKAGAAVIAPNGKPFTTSSIGAAVATRAIMADLRSGVNAGSGIGGPPPYSKQDRSRFLQALDAAVVKLRPGP